MSISGKAYQTAHEIGRIYDAIIDSATLNDFFLTTVFQLIPAKKGYLFLATQNKTLLLETVVPLPKTFTPELFREAQKTFNEGKPTARDRLLSLPVIARNSMMGVACFERDLKMEPFNVEELELGFDLTSQFSGALKNILLFEENLKLDRLAAVGQAMGMVIHEVKNIMQLARFSDEMIRMGLREKNDTYLDKGLAKMAKALQEMDGFALEMLSLTKDYQLEPEKMSVLMLLEELGRDLTERAQGNRIQLDFKAEPGFQEVEGDGRAIYRALLNLVKNSFEAFQDRTDARVKIRAHIKDAVSYEITVEDNASGMSEEVRSRLFEAFFSTKGKRGTGLGLMIVLRTVKLHQGEIRVESRLGVGTKFILTLPRFYSK